MLATYDVLFLEIFIGLALRIRKSDNYAILLEPAVNLLQSYQGSND